MSGPGVNLTISHLFLQLSPKEKVAPGVVAVITSRVNDTFLGVGEDGEGTMQGLGTTFWGKADLGCDFEGCEHLQAAEKRINKVQAEAVGKNNLSLSHLGGQGKDLGGRWRDPHLCRCGRVVSQPGLGSLTRPGELPELNPPLYPMAEEGREG